MRTLSVLVGSRFSVTASKKIISRNITSPAAVNGLKRKRKKQEEENKNGDIKV